MKEATEYRINTGLVEAGRRFRKTRKWITLLPNPKRQYYQQNEITAAAHDVISA
jgi:hypothetical protein